MAIIMHVCITNMQCLLVACGFRTKSSRVSYNISDGGLRGGNFHNLSGKITLSAKDAAIRTAQLRFGCS